MQQRTIFLMPVVYMSNLLSPLARRLKIEQGFRVVLVVPQKSRLPNSRLFDFDLADFDEVVYCDSMHMPRPHNELPSLGTLTENAGDLEKRTGVRVLQSIRADRMFGIDFVTTSAFHRSHYGRSADYVQTLDIALRLHEFAEGLLDRYQPEAVVGYPGNIFTMPLINLAEARGIPMLMLWPPRRENLHTWITDRWGWMVGLQEAYDEEFPKQLESAPKDEAPPQADEIIDMPERMRLHMQKMRRSMTVRALLTTCYRMAREGLADRIRGRHFDYGKYVTTEKIKQVVERWFWRRRIAHEQPVLPTIAKDTRFIFMPLHVEPEASLQVEAQWADNQLAIIGWLAKTAPAGWLVVVKEHPGQPSARINGFWEQLRQMPNVLIAATLEPAEALAARADIVAVVNSTVGLQAALHGKPVITYHKKYIGRLMQHVLFADSYDTTEAAIRRVISGDIPDFTVRRAAGRAYLASFKRFEFPITDPSMLAGRPSREPLPQSEFDLMFRHMLETIDSVTSQPGGRQARTTQAAE